VAWVSTITEEAEVTLNPLAAHIDAIGPGERFDFFRVSDELRASLAGRQPTSEELAEQFAMMVICRKWEGQVSPWGGYFAPFASWTEADGSVVDNPPLSLATPAWIEYWTRRSETTPHPAARARYADLVWDLWKKVGGSKPSVDVPRRAIDSYVEVLDRALDDHDVWSQATMARAVEIAQRLGDPDRTRVAVASIIRRQGLCTDPEAPGTWGMAFKVLLAPGGPAMDPAQVQEVVGGVEAHVRASLERVRKSGIPHPAMDFVRMLAEYYRRTGQEAEVARVLGGLVDAMLGGEQQASGLVRLAWYEDLDKMLRDHGMSDLRRRLVDPLKDAGKATVEAMPAISTEFTIPTARVREFVDSYTALSGENLLTAIASGFLIPAEDVKRQVVQQSRHAPLSSMIGRKTLDSRGRVVATVGSIAEDPYGNLIAQAAQSLQINTLFLHMVLQEVQASGAIGVEGVVEFCFASPAFDRGRGGILRHGIAAYLAKDWVAALHLLVPCFEDAVRELARHIGPIPNEFDPNTGGWREPGLGNVLRLAQVVDQIGDDLILHWKALFADSRGLNLRNRVAHGLLTDEDCSQQVAERVLHAILQVGQFRVVEAEQGSAEAS
jgi:hypothetical protein